MEKANRNKLVALLNVHDDDVYCFRREVIEGLYQKGYDLLLSCPYGEKLELLGNIEYAYDNVKIDRRGMNVFKDFALFLHYYRLLRKHRPLVVLTYTIKPNIYASIACMLLDIPYINNVTGLGIIYDLKGMIRNFILTLLRNALRRSSCVFFQNEENLKYAVDNRLVKGKYKLIPGSGVNTEYFAVQTYPEKSEVVVFNYIGRVLKGKGVDDYIEAAKRIKSKYPNTEFNIIGFIESTESYYSEQLKELEARKIIVYRGSQKDIRPFIARSHCTVHPSKYGEGMSNVLLESAASGRPLITTNVAGCREIVDDGITGYIYQAGDIDALVRTIEVFLRMSNDAQRAMGLAGRSKVEKSFNRQIVVNEYISEIESLSVGAAN